MNFLVLNNISKSILSTLRDENKVVDEVDKADVILVRSFEMKEFKMPENILAVARAGIGVNNIPFDDYAKRGIVVFNTPGANANAVKELVVCSLFLVSRDIIAGKNWVDQNKANPNVAKLVEKTKIQFAGNEIYGKRIAVLGLGKIGILVANACYKLGMKVYGYDPYLTINNAIELDKNIHYVNNIDEAIKDSDFITVHIPATSTTNGMINKSLLEKAKDGVKILNFSRDTLVNDDDLRLFLENNKVGKYITDFANPKVVNFKNTIVLPHLGASTKEAEDNCALMAVDQLINYVQNGNIINSVNLPNIQAGIKGDCFRICIIHYNIDGILAKFSTMLSDRGHKIINLLNKSKNELAYTIIDIENESDVSFLTNIDGVIKVRVIK